MKKILFLLLLLASGAYAEGPLFQHKDPAVQQEFENIYGDNRHMAAQLQTSTLASYRPPNLQWVSTATVQIETGIDGVSGDSNVIFPDGKNLTDSTTYHYTLDVRRVYSSSGFTQSGLARSTVTTDGWYFVYAVELTGNATGFILIADTTTATQGNYSNLNTSYGTNNWRYISRIRVGDNSAVTSQILNFDQAGAIYHFKNTLAFAGGNASVGINLANANASASASWAYSSGMGAANVPADISICEVGISGNVGSTGQAKLEDSGGNTLYSNQYTASLAFWSGPATVKSGFKATLPAASNMMISLRGFTDPLLAGSGHQKI